MANNAYNLPRRRRVPPTIKRALRDFLQAVSLWGGRPGRSACVRHIAALTLEALTLPRPATEDVATERWLP